MRGISVLLILAFVFIFHSPSTAAPFGCLLKGTASVPFGECSLDFQTDLCVKRLFHRRFQTTVTEATSGASANFRWADAPEAAAVQAVQALTDEHPELIEKCFGEGVSTSWKESIANDDNWSWKPVLEDEIRIPRRPRFGRKTPPFHPHEDDQLQDGSGIESPPFNPIKIEEPITVGDGDVTILPVSGGPVQNADDDMKILPVDDDMKILPVDDDMKILPVDEEPIIVADGDVTILPVSGGPVQNADGDFDSPPFNPENGVLEHRDGGIESPPFNPDIDVLAHGDEDFESPPFIPVA